MDPLKLLDNLRKITNEELNFTQNSTFEYYEDGELPLLDALEFGPIK